MLDEPSMSIATLRPHNPDDDPAIVDLGHRLEPEHPAETVEEVRGYRALVPPGMHREETVAERDGRLVGHSLLLARFWVDSPGSYSVFIRVDPDHWGQGIGSALYRQVQDRAEAWHALRLFATVREDRPDALQFAVKRGFKETGHVGRKSRLDVRSAILHGYDELAERLSGEDIRVARLAELGPDDEELLRAVHATQMTAAKDEPTPEPLSIPFDRWRTSTLKQPGVSPETVWIALDGTTPIGVTMLQLTGGDAGHHFGMTVDRAYRGRGVARLMKLRQIEWARDHGVRFLYTENDINNPRMYDINVRLGYQALPGSIGLVKELGTQEKK